MEKFTQKYSIVSFFDDFEDGYEFHYSSWPLHVTLADTFSIGTDINKVMDELELLMTPMKSLTLAVGEDAYFGPDKDVHVVLLNMSAELIKMHYEIVNLLKNNGLVFNDPQYQEEGYLAHIAVRPDTLLSNGESVVINKLSIVDMFPSNDGYQRKILKTIKFNTMQPSMVRGS